MFHFFCDYIIINKWYHKIIVTKVEINTSIFQYDKCN